MKQPENIQAVARLQPDYMGFIFYSRSPRYAGDLDATVLRTLPASIVKTGVFVNETAETVIQTIDRYQLDAVQLHGVETPETCRQIQAQGTTVIKAFSVKDKSDIQACETYGNHCNYFLFDTQTPTYGGSGQTFDWNILDEYQGNTPFFLSGGITAGHAEAIHSLRHPSLWGIDLNSKFETAPGMKDIARLRQFIENIRTTF